MVCKVISAPIPYHLHITDDTCYPWRRFTLDEHHYDNQLPGMWPLASEWHEYYLNPCQHQHEFPRGDQSKYFPGKMVLNSSIEVDAFNFGTAAVWVKTRCLRNQLLAWIVGYQRDSYKWTMNIFSKSWASKGKIKVWSIKLAKYSDKTMF